MKIVAASNPKEVASHCADLLTEIVRTRAEPTLILPAGSTPLSLYEELVWRYREGLDLSAAHIFQLDELVGPGPDHGRSFHSLLRDMLLEPISHPAERTHLLDGSASDPAAEIARHAEELAARGGTDVTILGIGLNGHVAFNEPGTTLDAPARLTELNATTIRCMSDQFPEDHVPMQGLTMGLREIAASRHICVIVTGESKADVLHAMLTEPPSSQLPASLLLSHESMTIIADEPARARFQTAT